MGNGTSLALVVAACLFVAFLVAKLGLLRPRSRLSPEVRRRVREAVLAARRERTAATWLAAGTMLVREAHRPSQGAIFAQRALAAEPSSVEAVELLREGWLAAKRPRKLERVLWRVLERAGEGPAREAARDGLAELYEGPLRSPAKLEALRRVRADRDAGGA